MGERRQELLEAALRYVLAHGLSQLSLRPLAAVIGTSDRMLVYHFGSKQQLVDEMCRRSRQLHSDTLRHALSAPSARRRPGDVVRHYWRLVADPTVRGLLLLEAETGILEGRSPGSPGTARMANTNPVADVLTSALVDAGVAARRARGLAVLIAGSIAALAVERAKAGTSSAVEAAVRELAATVDAAARPRK